MPAGAAPASPSPSPAITLVDDRGVRVTLQGAPMRIVSLLPSLTETVCALGACQRIVGVDRYSNHPAEITRRPVVGGLNDASVEMIAGLKPDVVLLSVSARVTDRLTALGIPVIALEPRSHADVRRVLGQVAQMLGQQDQGERVWQDVEAKVAQAARRVPASVRGMRVYFEVDGAPYAASEASFIGQTLHRLGMANIVPASLGPFPKLNPEFVVRADPQWIMVTVRSAGGLRTRPGWRRIQALQAGRLCVFDVAQADVLTRAGPRLGEGALLMAACLSGQAGQAGYSGGRP